MNEETMNYDGSGKNAIVQEWFNTMQSVRGINTSLFEVPGKYDSQNCQRVAG